MKAKTWILSTVIILFLFTQYGFKSFEKNLSIQNQNHNMDIQYAYTILYVDDVVKTIEFYNQAFGFQEKFVTPEKDYGEIISGSTTLAFANIELGNSNFKDGFKKSSIKEKPFGLELAFTTNEVEQVMSNAIKYGAEILSETVEKPWGQKVGYLRDINGFIIEICTPIVSE